MIGRWKRRISGARQSVSDGVDARLRRLRDFVIRVLVAIGDPEADGGIKPDARFAIDDGVDYALPLVVPEWVTPEQRADLVTAHVREANAAYHFQFDRPYLYNENPSQFPTAAPLREWDHATRREVITRSHLAYERNPLAKRALNLTTEFVMGDGLTVSYSNQDVKAVIEAFRANAENDVEGYEKSLCTDIQADGELFIQYFRDEQGQTVIVPIPPWEIPWIVTELGFRRRVQTYHRIGQQSTGLPGSSEPINEDIASADVLHVAINRHSYETRGRPDLFVILPWLKAYKDWLENRARQNYYRGAIIYDVTLDGAQPGVVSAKRAQYKQPPSPGSIAIHNDKEHWAIQESKVGASDVAEDGRQIKLMSAVGKGLPEYMLADGENSNLASATAQQLPALRTFGAFQDVMVGQLWKPIYREVIRNAVKAGILEAMVEQQDADGEAVLDAQSKKKMIKAEDAFDVTAPELESDDPKTLAEALQIATAHGWASDETASGRMGFEYDIEQKKVEKQLARDRDRMAQGLVPGGFDPARSPLAGFGGQQQPPGGNGNGNGGAPKAPRTDPATGAPKGQTAKTSPVGEAKTESPLAALGEMVGLVIEHERQDELHGTVVATLKSVERIGPQVDQLGQRLEQASAAVPAAVARAVAPISKGLAALTEMSEKALTHGRQKDLQELEELAAMREAMQGIANKENAPVTIQLEDEKIRRIARQVAMDTARTVVTDAAKTISESLETLTQEVTERDEEGRVSGVTRLLANGTAIHYRIRRDAAGRMASLERD